MEPTLGLRRDLCRAMRRLRPDVVVTGSHDLRFRPGMSNQADHRAVGICVLDAAKDCGNRWIFPELVAEGYEPWTGLKAVIAGASTQPTHYLDVTGHLEPAIASLEAHQAYNEALPGRLPEAARPRDDDPVDGGAGRRHRARAAVRGLRQLTCRGPAQPTTRNAGTVAGLRSSSHSANSSGDIGRPIQKPWARSQPSSCSRRNVASSSTPSATTS